MTRARRLQSARAWLAAYPGRSVVRGYAKWFGVDLGCALIELQMLGVPLDPTYVKQLQLTLHNRAVAAKKASEARRARRSAEVFPLFDQDDEFAYIAGYTAGGAPFGTRWEELAVEVDTDELPVPDQDDECAFFPGHTEEGELFGTPWEELATERDDDEPPVGDPDDESAFIAGCAEDDALFGTPWEVLAAERDDDADLPF